jgi:hypothetical protein
VRVDLEEEKAPLVGFGSGEPLQPPSLFWSVLFEEVDDLFLLIDLHFLLHLHLEVEMKIALNEFLQVDLNAMVIVLGL